MYAFGELHAPNAPPSSEHSNVEPASSEENENDASRFVVEPSGCASIVVSGASKSGVAERQHQLRLVAALSRGC